MNRLFPQHSDHPLFRYFTDAERRRIEKIGEVKTIRADEFLIRARDRDSTLCGDGQNDDQCDGTSHDVRVGQFTPLRIPPTLSTTATGVRWSSHWLYDWPAGPQSSLLAVRFAA